MPWIESSNSPYSKLKIRNGLFAERLRVYVKNLSYDITDERYRDDLERGVTRLIKSGAENLSRDAALARAEAEINAMIRSAPAG